MRVVRITDEVAPLPPGLKQAAGQIGVVRRRYFWKGTSIFEVVLAGRLVYLPAANLVPVSGRPDALGVSRKETGE